MSLGVWRAAAPLAIEPGPRMDSPRFLIRDRGTEFVAAVPDTFLAANTWRALITSQAVTAMLLTKKAA
ncbi:hypothetical protein NE236_23795 [Actinoallomurus purpureus]|uniref:hypothetical protein n=1 Tax=Actinoallomurus purpureus TaxID=478114 RepID=UPI002093CD8B|nr:hypothetical protein [Actinoallomurus purpureus]MCO6008006.1 hypothetical protein [Actinoallomurus purpureus]